MWVLYFLLVVLVLLTVKFGWSVIKAIFKTLKWSFIVLVLTIVAFIVYYIVAVDIKYPANTNVQQTAEVKKDTLGS